MPKQCLLNLDTETTTKNTNRIFPLLKRQSSKFLEKFSEYENNIEKKDEQDYESHFQNDKDANGYNDRSVTCLFLSFELFI